MAEFSFYALQPFYVERDRFYKVYAYSDGLYGAWVAGQVFSWRAATVQLLVFAPLAYWPLAARKRREAIYDGLADDPQRLLASDGRNFFLPRSSITALQPTDRRKSWTTLYGGSTLTIDSADRRIDLIVFASDTPQSIADRLRERGYGGASFAAPLAWQFDNNNPYRSPRFGR